jgi:hypothetical protein
MWFFLRALPVLLALVIGAGCSTGRKSGPSAGPSREDDLREVGNMVALYSGEFRRGYAKPTDLARYETGYPLGYQAIASGAIVVVPGATMPGEGDSSGTTAIVAYEKDAPTQGGLVLLHNGTVKTMTAEQFAAAPKAGG